MEANIYVVMCNYQLKKTENDNDDNETTYENN